MIKLGGTSSVKVRKDNEVLRLIHAQPTTTQRTEYHGKLGEIRPKLDTPQGLKRLLELRVEAASQILRGVEGEIEVPEGQDVVDVMKEYGFDYLIKLAMHVFEADPDDVEVDLGKSEETPSSSTQDVSAGSNGSGASTSPSAPKASGTPSAETAPTT